MNFSSMRRYPEKLVQSVEILETPAMSFRLVVVRMPKRLCEPPLNGR